MKKLPKNFAKLIFPLTKNKYIQDFIILLKNKTERLICRKSATTINLMCKKYQSQVFQRFKNLRNLTIKDATLAVCQKI